MPDFPRTHSERALTTRQPRALRNDANIQNEAGKRTKIATGAIDAMSTGLAKWEAAVEKVQSDTALYNYKTGLAEISSEAVMDQDITSESKYQKRVQDLRKTVTDGMNNPRLAKSMAPQLNYMETMGAIGIQTEFRKKTVIHGQKIAMDNLNLIAQSPTATSAKEIEASVKDAVKAGYWNEVEGAKIQKKYTDQMRENMFIQDLNEDPATAEKKLLKNSYGFTVEELNNAQKIFERELQVIRNQTEEELIDMQINGTLEEDVVKEMRKLNKIDATFAKSIIKNLNTVAIPKVGALESVTQANILADEFIRLKSKEWAWKSASFDERTQFRANVFEAHRKGYIDTKTLDAYLGETGKKFFSSPEFTTAMDKAVQTSTEYVGERERAVAQQLMTKALMDKVADGMNPTDALDLVVTERIESDFPGYEYKDLLATSQDSGDSIQKVWENMERMRKERDSNA